MLSNVILAIIKILAGIFGHSYALIADGIESIADIVASAVIWGGLRVASRPASERHPYGYGKAEAMAAVVVAMMIIAAACLIAVEAVREILIPHHSPASFTLIVLVVVVITKEILFRTVERAAAETKSAAVKTDAWHHRADAITSGAAFIGITMALIGGPGWEPADDWAALVAAGVILVNGGLLLRTALRDLMDRAPEPAILSTVSNAALTTPGVLAVEKLKIRKSGTAFYVDIHVQADPALSLHDAHILSGMVKTAIRRQVPAALGVLIHMEPFEPTEKS
jgi:cation diffusion facilitator family transporter